VKAPAAAEAKLSTKATYTVQAGDTMYGVARRFGQPARELAALNGMSLETRIVAGQQLAVPGDSLDGGAQSGATGPAPRTVMVVAASRPSRPVAPPRPAPTPVRTEAPAPIRAATVPPPPPPPPPVQIASAPPPAAAPIGAPAPAPTSARPPPLAVASFTPSGLPPIGAVPAAKPLPGGVAASLGASADAEQEATILAPSVGETEIAREGRGRFTWPVRGEVVSTFGPKGTGQRNDGLNIAGPAGQRVAAAASGEVVFAGELPGFGNLVLLKHDGGWVTAYAHLSKIEVKMRQRVAQGQGIGQMGQTGMVDSPQLHFEIRYAATTREKARPVDPAMLLPGAG
jgi:murein DD-endopeptidase MepM/ murein hydrolase activator NlpD